MAVNLLVSSYSLQAMGDRLTDVVEGTAGGWRHLKEAWVDERSEGGRRLVFLHVVTRLALKSDGIRVRADKISLL